MRKPDSADRKLTRAEIRHRWPDPTVLDDTIIQRWLLRAVDAGLLRRDGEGLRGSPYRYWLPSREAAWHADPLAVFRMPELMQTSGQ